MVLQRWLDASEGGSQIKIKVLSMMFTTKSSESSRIRVGTLGVFYTKVEGAEINRIAKVKCRD